MLLRLTIAMKTFARFLAFTAAATSIFTQAAPLTPRFTNDLIEGKYIIQLKPDTDIAAIAAHHNRVHARNLARRRNGDKVSAAVEREYNFGEFKGYAGSFDAATIEELKNLPEVRHRTSLTMWNLKLT